MCQTKPDFETSFTGAGFKFDFTAMTIGHNAVADDQAKAGAGADGFGGEKWLEQVRLNFRGNAGAIVHDFDDQLIILDTGSNADFAVAIDGINGVINEIGPDLVEFAAILAHARQLDDP